MRVEGASMHNMKCMTDYRGALCAAEVDNGLPFPPRRIFYVYNVPSSNVRGEHAHKECHQLLICLGGRLTVKVDDGMISEEVGLDDPAVGLWLKPGVWRTQYNHEQGKTLLVLASHVNDADDYIRNYDEFLAWKKE